LVFGVFQVCASAAFRRRFGGVSAAIAFLDVPQLTWERRAGIIVRAREPLAPLADTMIGALRDVCRNLGIN
jgi:hypothetical protein